MKHEGLFDEVLEHFERRCWAKAGTYRIACKDDGREIYINNCEHYTQLLKYKPEEFDKCLEEHDTFYHSFEVEKDLYDIILDVAVIGMLGGLASYDWEHGGDA